MVLSTMAAEIDGTFVGTAPKASYLLIRTEADAGEYLCEPDFWVSGMEYADSIGVDLATTSLGYTTFDDSRMNYTYQDLNGKTARASIAATMAFHKGILLLNAAGNEGNKTWKYISVPADAEGVITVGSVSRDSLHSVFSSIGPTSDGRVKPELCAMGASSAVITTSGSTGYYNGTSFATPILAGLTACYLQSAKSIKPSHTLSELRENLYKSANNYAAPTPQLGYGLPDFQKALATLQNTKTFDSSAKQIRISIQRDSKILSVTLLDDSEAKKGKIHIYNVSGQKVKSQSFNVSRFTVPIESLKQGIYLLQIENATSNSNQSPCYQSISFIIP
jgi:subtilisin family serine protease